MNAIQLTIGELNLYLCSARNGSEWTVAVKFGDTTVDVEYECQPGQRAILNRAPEDCQPGYRASVAIWGLKTAEPMTYEAEGVTTTINAGVDIFHLVSRDDIERLEDEIVKGMAEARDERRAA